jgi:hypothetical protein
MDVTESNGRLKTLIENIHGLYTSTSTIRMIKSSIMKFQGHVDGMGYKRNAHSALCKNPKKRDNLKYIGVQ